MTGKYNLSNTELEIMEMIWQHEEGLCFGDILSYFNEEGGHQWKKQTLKTFLTRLIEKTALMSTKSGNRCTYYPAMTREKYEQQWSQKLLDNDFNGSVKNFMVALTGGGSLDRADIDELKELLNEWENI